MHLASTHKALGSNPSTTEQSIQHDSNDRLCGGSQAGRELEEHMQLWMYQPRTNLTSKTAKERLEDQAAASRDYGI